jgi:hypothetical protein
MLPGRQISVAVKMLGPERFRKTVLFVKPFAQIN